MPIQTANAAQSDPSDASNTPETFGLRRIFDRRAATFERVAFLPREISGRMMERLEYIKVAPQHVLDAGCGPGSDIATLAARYPTAHLSGVDLSHGMVSSAVRAGADASDGLSRWLPGGLRKMLGRRSPWLVQADFSALPFAGETFDMLWSNLALHWHATPDTVFPEWQRVLAVGGLLMFSTLGPDTLRELRAAWQEADAETRGADGSPRVVPVLDFVDMHDFGDMLVASGFELPVMDMETLTITYRDPEALLADVRGWGAYPWGQTRQPDGSALKRPQGLRGRRMHQALLAALARRRREDGTIPLTFEVVYGHAWKAKPRQNAAGHAVVRLDDIGGRRRRE
jgi:malonyl-CoA O-methyltransferase